MPATRPGGRKVLVSARLRCLSTTDDGAVEAKPPPEEQQLAAGSPGRADKSTGAAAQGGSASAVWQIGPRVSEQTLRATAYGPIPAAAMCQDLPIATASGMDMDMGMDMGSDPGGRQMASRGLPPTRYTLRA